MRGRKDGRDQQFGPSNYDELAGVAIPGSLLRENDDSGILHLVGDNRPVHLTMGSFSRSALSTPAPRQFASQFAYRHQMQDGEQVEPEMLDTGISFEPMMQAKLRRGFHPMRGKRASNMLELADAD